jgi:hypothetical protein
MIRFRPFLTIFVLMNLTLLSTLANAEVLILHSPSLQQHEKNKSWNLSFSESEKQCHLQISDPKNLNPVEIQLTLQECSEFKNLFKGAKIFLSGNVKKSHPQAIESSGSNFNYTFEYQKHKTEVELLAPEICDTFYSGEMKCLTQNLTSNQTLLLFFLNHSS